MTSNDDPSLYADRHGQTKDMHPAEILEEAKAHACANHPEAGFTTGVGYAGGGFGSYKRCSICDRVYSKTAMKDGNDASPAGS